MSSHRIKLIYLIELLFKYQWKIGVIVLISVLPVLMKSIFSPNIYEASTKILISRGETHAASLSPMPLLSQQEEINSEMEILRSRALAQRVYRKLEKHRAVKSSAEKKLSKSSWLNNLKKLVRVRFQKNSENDEVNELIQELQNDIHIEPIKGSNVIQVRYQGTDKEETAWILQTIVAEYIELHIKVHSLTHAEAFFKERIVNTKAKLDSLENALKDYKTSKGMIAFSLLENRLLDQITDYEGKLTRIKNEIMSREKKLHKAKKYLESDSIFIIPIKEIAVAPSVIKLREKIIDLKLQRNTLLKQHNFEFLPLKSVNREIKLAENELKIEMKKQLAEEEAYLNSLRAEEEALQVTLDVLHNKSMGLPEKELIVNRLNLAIENYRDLYSLLIKKYEELRISEASDARMVNIKPLNGDDVFVESIGPHRIRNIVLAASLGFLLSISVILVIEYLNPVIRGEADCETLLNLPLLEVIPEIKELESVVLENSNPILLRQTILN